MLCFERQTDRSFFSSFFFTFFPVFLSFLVLIVGISLLLFVCVVDIAINGVLFRIRWLRVVFVIFANFLILLNLFLFLFYFFLAFYCLCFAFSLPILYSTLSTICFYSDGRTRPTLLNAPIAIVTYAMLLQVRVPIGKILIAMHFLLQIGMMLGVFDV
mgnify:CR=1 FL=1